MASMRDIKRRIKSVNSTRQITKAMNLVASSKLNKAKARLEGTKPFAEETRKVIAEIGAAAGRLNNPLFAEEVKGNKALVIVLTGDKGLCGGYNSNVCKETQALCEGKDAKLITVGTKGRDYFKRRSVPIDKSVVGISEHFEFGDAVALGERALKMYKEKEVDAVYLVSTKYISSISSAPKSIRLLPVNPNEFEGEAKADSLVLYEPSEEAVLEYIVPKYVNTVIYGGLVEASVCELGARMTAMDAATDNAKEMLDSLNLLYNRVRQGAITNEITEIVNGSNALSQ
ncbi:MAG: ATP synthase F1 subunit gamma [Clostridiales bacterium]|nr:ATP synthase F1 subunit gamma [Clostridiales bacterium]